MPSFLPLPSSPFSHSLLRQDRQRISLVSLPPSVLCQPSLPLRCSLHSQHLISLFPSLLPKRIETETRILTSPTAAVVTHQLWLSFMLSVFSGPLGPQTRRAVSGPEFAEILAPVGHPPGMGLGGQSYGRFPPPHYRDGAPFPCPFATARPSLCAGTLPLPSPAALQLRRSLRSYRRPSVAMDPVVPLRLPHRFFCPETDHFSVIIIRPPPRIRLRAHPVLLSFTFSHPCPPFGFAPASLRQTTPTPP